MLMFPSTFRPLESFPTPSRSAEIVCLYFFSRRGIFFIVTPACRHLCTPKYMDFQTPTHCRFVVVLTGVIFAASSELRVDGDAMFTNNSAEFDGGENGRGTCMFNACT